VPERSEFELLGRVTIGQYLPTGSFVHRLDPRAKLLMALLLIIAVVASASLMALALLLLTVLLALAVARIPLRFALSGLVPMLPFLLLLALLQVFAIPQYSANATLIWRWALLTMTDRSLLAGILLILRFATMVLGLSLFSFSTTTTELTHGIEHLLRPLQAVRLPGHEFALVVNIAIRFLPILAEEAERLMKAQASRGADFGRGKRNPIQQARLLLPLLVPLFLVALRRAEELTEAMEARCYLGGRGRTHLIHLEAKLSDYIASIGMLALAAFSLCLTAADADTLLWRHLASLL
jgi:energy-coupling factor transport system permease protein